MYLYYIIRQNIYISELFSLVLGCLKCYRTCECSVDLEVGGITIVAL